MSYDAESGEMEGKLLGEVAVQSRRAMFEAIAVRFEKADRARRVSVKEDTTVWVMDGGFSLSETKIDLDQGHFLLTWLHPEMTLSVAVRIGETRIGFRVPRIAGDSKVSTLTDPMAYPPGIEGVYRLSRALGDSADIVDYVFSGVRLGNYELTCAALSGDRRAQDLLSDAIYYEASHLRAAIVHQMNDAGLYSDGSGEVGAEPIEFTSNLGGFDLLEHLNVSASRLSYCGPAEGGKRHYTVLAKPESVDTLVALLRQIDANPTLPMRAHTSA